MKYGFVKTATAVPVIQVADCHHNAYSIISAIGEATQKEVELILFPELCITSCSCGELYTHPHLLDSAQEALVAIAASTAGQNPVVVVGTPVAHSNSVYDCAAVIYNGKIFALVPKQTTEFPFTSGNNLPANATVTIDGTVVPIVSNAIFQTPFYTFAIEVGDDAKQPTPPAIQAAVSGAHIILNPANGKEVAGTNSKIKARIAHTSEQCHCCYLYASSGWGESTGNSVHSGYNAIAEEGAIIAEGKRFATQGQITITEVDCEKTVKRRRCNDSFTQKSDIATISIPQQESETATFTRTFDPAPFTPQGADNNAYYDDIFTI